MTTLKRVDWEGVGDNDGFFECDAPSESTFNALLYGDFTPTDRDIAMHEMAERYHADCEAYDQIHCSFTNERGVAIPGSYYELALINRNALSVRKRLSREYESFGFTAREMQNAISKWHG